MSTWRVVERHYGFGAARIPIQPEAHRRVELSFVAALGSLADSLFEGGAAATARRFLGQSPALLLAGLILFTLIAIAARDRSEQAPIEVVLFETPPLQPEPAIEVVEPEPPKPVVPLRPPPPLPEPVRLAERPKPPPPEPVAIPRPLPREKPVIPQIAKIEVPKPQVPLERIERSVREEIEPIARPRVAIDVARVAAVAPPIAAPTERVARRPVDLANSARLAPSLVAAPAPALDPSPGSPPERAFRLANAPTTSRERPRALPGLAAAPRVVGETSPQTPTQRVSRAAAPVPREAERASARPVVQLAAVSPASAVAKPASVVRSGRATPETPRGSQADRPGVAGVPLGDLAACVQDRDEDRLKQAVVAAVTTQEECVSSKGTYRFVETKNLNAFLMWVDRGPSRPVEDRCVELGYALECLENASRRAAR